MILILTAGFGDGHNTAARNVAQALQYLHPDEEAQVVDLFDVAHPHLGMPLKQGYQMLITRAPAVWAWIYRRAAKMTFDGPPDILARLRRCLGELLEKARPHAVICTYPLYAKLLRDLAAQGCPVPRVLTVITDSISIHPVWLIAPSDAYFVADEDSKASAVALGAEESRVHVAGFPVNLDFLRPPAAEQIASEHGKILYLPSTGVRRVAATLEALRPLIASGVKLTLPVGKHASRLYHVITHYLDSLPEADIEILGWTNRIPQLLQTHDLVICKAGGAILHEALAATCPAVIDYVVPGQEEGNAELLVRHDCGVTTQTAAETGLEAQRLLADDRRLARRMKQNMQRLSEPDAALKIAQQAMEVIAL